MRPLDCRSLRIRRSIRSSFARAIRFPPLAASMPEPCRARNKVARIRQLAVNNCVEIDIYPCISGEVCIYVEDMRLAGCGADMAETHRSKVIILGSGPAGYTAAIYAARASLKPMLVQGIQPGGQLTITTDVENYPGFADVIQGPWLMEQMQKQAEHVGTKLFFDTIVDVDLSRRPFVCLGDSGDRYEADSLDHRDRRHGQVAGPAHRGDLPRRRRVGLRDLRRLLLPRQGRGRGRRRQHRRRGGALPHASRLEGDPRSTAATASAPRRSCRTACSRIPRSRSSGITSSTRSWARRRRRRS